MRTPEETEAWLRKHACVSRDGKSYFYASDGTLHPVSELFEINKPQGENHDRTTEERNQQV